MPITNHIKITITLASGPLTRYYSFDSAAMSCGQAETNVRGMSETALKALPDTKPVEPFRSRWGATVCGGGGNGTDVITDIRLGETLPEEGGDTGGGGGGSGVPPPSITQLSQTNADVCSVVLEWQNGLARLNYASPPRVEGNENVFVFIGGQAPLPLPTPYGLSPGNNVQVIVVTAGSPLTWQNAYRQKASFNFTVPVAPTA